MILTLLSSPLRIPFLPLPLLLPSYSTKKEWLNGDYIMCEMV